MISIEFVSFILFIILIILYGIYVTLYKKMKRKEFYNNYPNKNPYLYGTKPNINQPNHNKPWKEKPVANKNPFYQKIPIDKKMTLTKSLDNPFKAYNLGIIDYSKIINPILTKKNILNKKFGNFNSLNLTDSCLHGDNKFTWINRANEIDINKPIYLKYIESKIDAVNKINLDFLKKFNVNQQRIVNKKLILENSLKDYMIYNYRIKDVLKNKDNKIRYQIIISLIKPDSYYNPVLYVDALSENNKIYYFNIEFIGQYNTEDTIMVNGYIESDKNSFRYVPLNYKRDNQIIKDIDTIIGERKNYLNQFKLDEQYACFNTDPSILESSFHPYQGGKELKEYSILNYKSKEDCEKKYDFLGREKKRGVWDKPCKVDEDCPFYKNNKHYPNTFGKCNKESGKCQLPLNMQNIGYHYFYPIKKYSPLCYNCDSDRWLPMTKLSKCCNEQTDKEKYPFLDGNPDYAFENDYQERTNYYLQKNCKLKSEGNKKIDTNIVCKKGTYNLY